ncbi:MAG: SpoIID/LytB domain-containing protein [Lachnospiraceae bacterium]|nr:SpoIID/LytB domain-containing protein [Lachnospiraceae bacterium]
MRTKKKTETKKIIQKSYIWEFCMIFCIMLMLPVNISLLFSKTRTEKAGDILETEEEEQKDVFESALEWEVLHELAKTIPADYELETLKAQAVILRTNILEKQSRKEENREDEVYENENPKDEILEDLTFWDKLFRNKLLGDREEGEREYKPVLLYAYKEKWGADYEENCRKLCDAVAQTKGMYLEKDRKPIRASYFRLSNGSTRNAEECFLKEYPEYVAAECRKDLMSDEFLQREKIEGIRFAAGINELTGEDFSFEQLAKAEITYQKDSAGYVLKVKIGEEEIGGEIFRQKFLLQSADFFITFEEQYALVETKGIGTGFGFCQYGANEMAKEGEDFLGLLNYFFTNIAISKTV